MSGETHVTVSIAPAPISVDALALRLADEGVPLRAIARVTRLPSDTIRTTLAVAKSDGRLLELPREDWPPGFPRDPRAWQLSRMMVEDRSHLLLATQQTFRITPAMAELLLALLQNQNLSKEARADRMPPKTLDVHICALRKRLYPYNIIIHTLWGFGYRLAPGSRTLVMDKITAYLGAAA